MDSSSSMRKQAQPIVRKGKKKQVKDEVDRIKQAEKKKRRLEKAIATSVAIAIRAELEKKKQKKKEGQQETADKKEEENSAKKKQEKEEVERIKQAEKKKIRLEKAIATSVAIRVELEKKKQKKKEGQQEAADKEEEENLAKKKQEKDGVERIKQAEKKKIRLEKSIATSVAIRVELEKKKLKKLEEQRRLDEEGAAISEAVALQVLLGEDCDDGSYRILLNQENGFKPWDYTTKFNLFTGGSNRFLPHQRCSSYAVHCSNRQRDSNWSSVSYEPFARGWDNNNMGMGISADLIAAQAVSSLRISENNGMDSIVFNGMLRR